MYLDFGLHLRYVIFFKYYERVFWELFRTNFSKKLPNLQFWPILHLKYPTHLSVDYGIEVWLLSQPRVGTLSKTEIIYPKNVRA